MKLVDVLVSSLLCKISLRWLFSTLEPGSCNEKLKTDCSPFPSCFGKILGELLNKIFHSFTLEKLAVFKKARLGYIAYLSIFMPPCWFYEF